MLGHSECPQVNIKKSHIYTTRNNYLKQGFIVRYSQFCENFKFDYLTVLVARSVERHEIKFALHVKQDHFFAVMKEKACCKCGTPLGFYFFVARVHSMLFYLFF